MKNPFLLTAIAALVGSNATAAAALSGPALPFGSPIFGSFARRNQRQLRRDARRLGVTVKSITKRGAK
jgi:hypothetical protein